jgi:hypothetical protein
MTPETFRGYPPYIDAALGVDPDPVAVGTARSDRAVGRVAEAIGQAVAQKPEHRAAILRHAEQIHRGIAAVGRASRAMLDDAYTLCGLPSPEQDHAGQEQGQGHAAEGRVDGRTGREGDGAGHGPARGRDQGAGVGPGPDDAAGGLHGPRGAGEHLPAPEPGRPALSGGAAGAGAGAGARPRGGAGGPPPRPPRPPPPGGAAAPAPAPKAPAPAAAPAPAPRAPAPAPKASDKK